MISEEKLMAFKERKKKKSKKQNMPSPWSSCQCQSEQGALVTLSPTPCRLHRKNTHLDDTKTQAVKD